MNLESSLSCALIHLVVGSHRQARETLKAPSKADAQAEEERKHDSGKRQEKEKQRRQRKQQ